MKKTALFIGASLGAAVVGLVFFFFAVRPPALQMPVDDFYWQGSQFEKAVLTLRGDSLEVLAGVPGAAPKAKQSVAMALSKIRMLTRESSAQDVLLRNAKFSENLQHLRDFQHRVLEAAASEDAAMDQRQAQFLLAQIDSMRARLDDLLPEIWQMQAEKNEQRFQIAEQRSRWNIGLGAAVTMLAWTAISMLVYFHLSLRNKNSELELKNKELAQSVDEKNQFIAMVSHELKSPLQAITLSAESLMPYAGVQAQQAVIGRLQRAASQLNLQLDDLLTLVRSDGGKLEYRPDLFEVKGLVEEIIDIESPAAQEKHLKLTIRAPQLPLFVMADSGRLAQILRNLVSNAIKYTDQGSVEIAVENANSHALIFLVSDTGPGMPPGFTPQSIQPFRRYGAIDKREGFGIGLSIAYSLTRYLGGTLDFVSSPQGTQFRLQVPVIVQADETVPAHVSGERLRVLLVDDRPELLESLREACSVHGMDADTALCAAAAANLMAVHRYDCALIDVNMPVRRGDELAQDFRRGGAMANRECLLIGMSAQRHPHLETDSPFHLMMDKPIHIRKLRRVLQRLASNSTSASWP